MNIYPIQTNFTSGILSPRFWARSDVAEYRSGVQDCENMITTRHGPIQSRNGTAFVSDLGDNYVRPFGFQLIPNSVTGEAFSAIVSEDLTIKIFGATGTLFEEELINTDFSISLDSWSKIFTQGLSTVNWSGGAAILTPESVQNGETAGVSQLVNVTGGTENDDRTISYNSVALGGTLPVKTTIAVGTTLGASDLLSFSSFGDTAEVVFNPAGATSYYISFICQQTLNEGEQVPGEPSDTYS